MDKFGKKGDFGAAGFTCWILQHGFGGVLTSKNSLKWATKKALGQRPKCHYGKWMVDHFFIFQKNSLHLKLANFSSLKRRSIFTSRKILREKLELHSASKKSLNIAKMVEKRFELPVSTHDLAYEKIRLADCHKIPIFSDKSENPHARVTGVHKFLTFTPPSVPVDNREASHQEMKPL